MKTLFNKKSSGKIIFPLLITIAFVLAGIFILKKTQQLEKESFYTKELTIDKVSDLRALGYSNQRKIVQDDEENIFVAYRKDFKENSEIFVAKIFQDISGLHVIETQEPIATINNGNEQRVPSLAIDTDNTVHAIWYGSDTEGKPNNRQVKYTRKPKEASKWESWRNIAYVSGYTDQNFWQEHPMLLTGKNNTLYAVWEGADEENNKQQIKFSRSTNGGTVWTKWKNILPTKDNTHSRPTLVEDKNGKIFLFAYSSFGNTNNLQQIQYTSSLDQGETWSPWQTISDSNFDSRHISAAIDDVGTVHVVWRAKLTNDGPSQIIYRNFFDDKWSASKIISPSKNYQFSPNIGLSKSGLMYVSWMENDNSSEFPQENPTGGLGLVSLLEKGIFQPPILLSNQNNLLYPNVSTKTNLQNFIPIFYAEQLGEKEFNLKLKFVNI